MSQENLEIVRATITAWNDRDMEAIRSLIDPDIVMRLPEGWPEPGPYMGREAVMREWLQARGAWNADVVEPISDFIHAGDRVVVRMAWRTIGSGPSANIELTVVYTIRDGKILLNEYFWDHAEALEAVGLSEQAMSRENGEKLQAFLEARDIRASLDAWNRGEADTSLFDPDVAYEDTIFPDHVGETYRGFEGVARATERWIEPYEELTLALEQVIGEDDHFVSVHRGRGKARHTGIEFEALFAYAWTFRNGKVIRFGSYADPAEALEAVGLSDQDAHADS